MMFAIEMGNDDRNVAHNAGDCNVRVASGKFALATRIIMNRLIKIGMGYSRVL
jgi:hypothetical protein